MILQAIVLILALAGLEGASIAPVEETDLKLTASDSDTGNWTANIGNVKINIEHQHNSAASDNVNGTWTLSIGRASYMKDEREKELKSEITSVTLPEANSDHHPLDEPHANNHLLIFDPNGSDLVPPPPTPVIPIELSPDLRLRLLNAGESAIGNDFNVEEAFSNAVTSPDNFEYFNEIGWLKFDKRLLNWDDAREACEAMGAHLAVPDTRSKVIAFQILLRKNEDMLMEALLTQQVYVGVNDPDMNRVFKTVQGEVFNPTFQVWNDMEPNNVYPGEYCVSFYKGGKINDIPCQYKLPFLCEKKDVQRVDLYV